MPLLDTTHRTDKSINQSYQCYDLGQRNGAGSPNSGILRTVNFGWADDATYCLQLLRRWQPTGPLFVSEYWVTLKYLQNQNPFTN